MNIHHNLLRKILHFDTPFKLSFEEVTESEVLFLCLSDGTGHEGVGSVALDTGVTRESIDGVYNTVSALLGGTFFDRPVSAWYYYHEKLRAELPEMPLARMLVESAILDLFSRQTSISLSILFGGVRESAHMMMTLSIMSVEETVRKAQERVKEGYGILKLKCGINVDEDIEKATKVAAAVGKKAEITLDANRAYSFSDAKKLLAKLKNIRIALIEQPVEVTMEKELKELTRLSPFPVVADESVETYEDAYRLLSGGIVNGINIKLMKCGGPVEFMKMFHLAKGLGKITMIGCTYESHVSITMGASLCMGLPVDFIDLDSGRLDFADDPTEGGARVERGVLSVESGVRLTI